MVKTLKLGSIEADVELKDIKNVHLSVYPPEGRVRIAAPSHMKLSTIRAFALGKMAWIRSQQRQLQEQERETAREFLDRESHFLWGKRYLLEVREKHARQQVETGQEKIILSIRGNRDSDRCEAILEEWYRAQVREYSAPLIKKWEKIMNVSVEKLFVQKMKTKWGSCTSERGYIRLNTELAKKPRECLEYLVVHEMVHLIETSHNTRFRELMDRYLPQWPELREKLNRLPVKHENWSY